MSKKLLREKQMGTEFVADARKWADALVMREYQGPGQMDRAIDRASQKTGLDRHVVWSLRYRPPTDILVSVYSRLKEAYEAECARQMRLYEHERALARKHHATDTALGRAADALAGTKD